jgi:hypothetical protein
MASAIAGFVCQLRDGGEGLSEEEAEVLSAMKKPWRTSLGRPVS